ncbi:unnamed protein product [Clonostachys rosea f. rosea IK726]|jgi:hypothetical protein|uniref:Uncharacterized protein n=1 Tax=Clonostachys rosea f. rosea IK726 TaxID=1349383 RepID=A0ACA9TC58_BIOOC|nr:unnamed protein product [Clonostachys rosea f. rosea IK726]
MASLRFHDPGWHGDLKTPVVDGKYMDPKSGEIKAIEDDVTEDGHPGYCGGPPAVDIIVKSIHEDTIGCTYRAARPFPMEALLSAIMKIVKEKQLELDSVMATSYAIRVNLASKLTEDEFGKIGGRMMNAIYDEKE